MASLFSEEPALPRPSPPFAPSREPWPHRTEIDAGFPGIHARRLAGPGGFRAALAEADSGHGESLDETAAPANSAQTFRPGRPGRISPTRWASIGVYCLPSR